MTQIWTRTSCQSFADLSSVDLAEKTVRATIFLGERKGYRPFVNGVVWSNSTDNLSEKSAPSNPVVLSSADWISILNSLTKLPLAIDVLVEFSGVACLNDYSFADRETNIANSNNLGSSFTDVDFCSGDLMVVEEQIAIPNKFPIRSTIHPSGMQLNRLTRETPLAGWRTLGALEYLTAMFCRSSFITKGHVILVEIKPGL